MSDGDSYEKTIIFGGITHSKLNSPYKKPGSSKRSKELVSTTSAIIH
jgi:hypothetical protein